MYLGNGIWKQIEDLPSVQTTPLTIENLTKTLMETQAKSINATDHSIYTNSEVADWFWEIASNEYFINVYGTKQINKQDDLFVYECVLFDEFPKNYTSPYVINTDSKLSIKIKILEVTDTKIVFKCPVALPIDKNNFVICVKLDISKHSLKIKV